MKGLVLFGLLVLAYDILGQDNRSAINPKIREVRGQTIISTALPEADLTFGKEFRYVGSQRVNLYGLCPSVCLACGSGALPTAYFKLCTTAGSSFGLQKGVESPSRHHPKRAPSATGPHLH